MQRPHLFRKRIYFALALAVFFTAFHTARADRGSPPTGVGRVYQHSIKKLYAGQVRRFTITQEGYASAQLQQKPAVPTPAPRTASSTALIKPFSLSFDPSGRSRGTPADSPARPIALPPEKTGALAHELDKKTHFPQLLVNIYYEEPDSQEHFASKNDNPPSPVMQRGLPHAADANPFPLSSGESVQPRSNTELAYPLPDSFLAQTGGPDAHDATASCPGQAPQTSADCDGEKKEYAQEDLPVPTQRDEGGTDRDESSPVRALAAYGSSSDDNDEAELFFGTKRPPVTSFKSITSVNRALFAPLGMYQLAVGGPESDQSSAPGESRFTRNFDLNGLSLSPSAGVYWYSEHYTDYHFGPSSKEIERNGLRERESLRDVSPFIGLTLDMNLTRNWSAFVNGEISLPGSRIRDNAMTGSHNESITTGIIYTFN